MAGEPLMPPEIRGSDCICLAVHDTGTGMSEEVLRSAIEPFFTTKEAGKGSGLGLSQVYGVVQQSSGSLKIDSALDQGTSVFIYLPRVADAAAAMEGRPDETMPERESGRILAVDDDPGVRDITVQMLRQIGYDVAEAESGQAALAALRRGAIYDLLVMDIAMPGLDGVETVRRARAIVPGLRVLYITGYTDPVGAQRGTGSDPLIKKPFRLHDLRAAVRLAIKPVPRHAGTALAPPGDPDRLSAILVKADRGISSQ